MREAPGHSLWNQRGFTLIDTLVTTSIVGLALLAVTALHGSRPPQRRAAALALQSALAETRALAASNADVTAAAPTGATLTIAPLPAESGTRLAVFSSRPMVGAPPLVADAGFPPMTVPVTIGIPGQTTAGQPFTIFVSSSGYASIAANYAYDPAQPRALASDPGCDETNGVTISISDAVSTDTHPFSCREARYDVDASVAQASPSNR